MAKLYKCDANECIEEMPKSRVTILGYRPDMAGGILLPQEFLEYHFCSPSCFEKWIGLERKNDS